jgi:flagellin
VDSLGDQLALMVDEAFNGISLFDGATLTVVTSEDGAQSIGISSNSADFDTDVAQALANGSLDISSAAGVATSEITVVTDAIQALATLRAENGAEQSRMSFAADMLSINKVNLESANSRIADLDIASESANLAKFNILQQAGTAMLAQANMSQQSILKLLI